MKNTYLKTALLVCLTTISLSSLAKSYTKDQLVKMINSENYPEQAESKVVNSETMLFSDCTSKSASIVSQIASDYPTKKIVSSDVLQIDKIWTNDGVIMITCSKPDNKLILNQASYK